MKFNTRIITISFLFLFLFLLFFNFSNAADNKQILIDALWQQILQIKARLLEIQNQLQILLLNNFALKQNTVVFDNKIDFSFISKSELKIEISGVATNEDYYEDFLDIIIGVNFSEQELNTIKKDQDQNQRAFLLEELMDLAISNGNTKGIKDSFSAWSSLDERAISELKKISVNQEMSSLHQWMISWYQYHSRVAERFANGNLSSNEMNQLSNEFKKNAEVHNEKFQKSLASLKNSSNFVLINTAEAFTCGAFMGNFFHFGGKVLLMKPCNFGIVETISPPCGGLFLFTYAVLAANPYLWKKPTIGSWVLGKSTVAPGACPLGACPGCALFPYEAIVLFFGTSLLP